MWPNVSFKACVSLFTFILDDLSIGESRVLKSRTVIVLLSISPVMAVSICLIYLGAPMFGVCLAVELVGHWVELGLTVETEISQRVLTN